MRKVLVLLALASLAGCAVKTTTGESIGLPSTIPAPTPSYSAPSVPPINCETDPYSRGLDSALFLPDGDEMCLTDESRDNYLIPMCTAHGTQQIQDGRAFFYLSDETFNGDPAPTGYSQTVVRFPAGLASAYMADLRAAIASCGTFKDEHHAISLSTGTGSSYGDETVHVTVKYRADKPGEGTPAREEYRAAVVRKGDLVMVLFDQGWEGFPSKLETFENATREAAGLLMR